MRVQKISINVENLGEKLLKSFENTGFAVISDYIQDFHDGSDKGVSVDTATTVNTWSKFFKGNTLEYKNQFLFTKQDQSGYFPFKAEKAKDAKVSDLKEFMQFRRENLDSGYKMPEETLQDSRHIFYYLEHLALQLIVNLEAAYNRKHKTNHNLFSMIHKSEKTMMRPIYYPSLEGQNIDGAVRSSEHTDINFITLLVAGNAPGLQVQDLQGNWHDVEIGPGEVVVNVGDMLSELTLSNLKSTLHRVVNPKDNSDRTSIPLFVHPTGDTNLGTRTANEFLEQRLKELGLL
jgi:isopenicillin N synthase-like dioxygenase